MDLGVTSALKNGIQEALTCVVIGAILSTVFVFCGSLPIADLKESYVQDLWSHHSTDLRLLQKISA